MGQEIDLLVNYPRTKRNVDERGQTKSEEDRAIARRFGKEFFDGDRRHGYGGFNYMPRFWQPVIPTFQQHFGLSASSSVLDVGCAKGFMLHDMAELIPGITVKGVDVSDYAIAHAIDDMKPHVSVASATKLPFADKSFDVVISINTVHNLVRDDCAEALREIERVARKGAFITVDAYRDEEEKRRMMAWNLTAQTIMHVDEWKAFFAQVGYTGDYYWFIP
ncbi:class I SAM-dependent methyltransferase [Rhodopseudomonas sp. BR0M22]|uniref:class I SAM-dependent methyltransferase n=1 Tax=Rhodopseudomonas sp. BR0M22 TaxID=2269369 RepID=UPI0013DEDDE4|nr:class I SAM-dependent methyltransferase [Rhodopseudomonas sp. BR0M22]NEW90563.1 class I SAM-dependent methyltransferase [Rhodopseudomonas sp. BR0M22]